MPARAAAAKGALGYVNAHPAVAAGLLGSLVGLAVMVRHAKAQQASAAPSGYAAAPGYLLPATADTSATDAISSVQPELDALTRQINAYRTAVFQLNHPTNPVSPTVPGAGAGTTLGLPWNTTAGAAATAGAPA